MHGTELINHNDKDDQFISYWWKKIVVLCTRLPDPYLNHCNLDKMDKIVTYHKENNDPNPNPANMPGSLLFKGRCGYFVRPNFI